MLSLSGIGFLGHASGAAAAGHANQALRKADPQPGSIGTGTAVLDTGRITGPGPHEFEIDLPNAGEIRRRLSSDGLSSAERTRLSRLPLSATITVSAEPTNESGSVARSAQQGCASGGGSWDCVYTLQGQCNDPIVIGGITQTVFKVFEGMSGNHTVMTNVSHPNYAVNQQYGWSPGTPSLSSGKQNAATSGWMNASEGFDLIRFAVHQQYNYQLTVYPDSSYTTNLSISCG